MIREVVQNVLDNNFDLIVDEICEYFGEEYEKELKSRADKVTISLIKDNGVISTKNGDVYVGDEPVCIKQDDASHVIIPLSMVCDARGNVSFIHVLIHALSDEVFIKDNKDAFNETVVDYMANEIAKQLKESGINVTMSNNPIYESNSFYSNMFSEIEEFYDENIEKIISARMGKHVEFKDVDEYIDGAQEVVDKAFMQEISKEDFVIKRR